jgi:transcription initiation factor TFIID subunit 2
LTSVTISDQRDVHLFPELKRKLYAAASDGQGGELAITIPPAVRVETAQSTSVPATPGPDNDAPTPGGPSAAVSAPGEANAITIRINYSLSNPADAIQLIRPTAEAPWRQVHMYTSPTCSDYARCWVPCVDSLWERNTWEFQYVVPRRLAEGPADEDSEGGESYDCVVISTGDLVEQVSLFRC